MDLFDRLQLNAVVEVCLSSVSLAQTGRTLFNASRTQKASSNDSHRLKQYLAKFGLGFGQISLASKPNRQNKALKASLPPCPVPLVNLSPGAGNFHLNDRSRGLYSYLSRHGTLTCRDGPWRV